MTLLLKSFAAAGLASLLLSTTVAAQSFDDGVTAAQRADYAGALRIFGDAAAQGDAKSEYALAEMYRRGQGMRPDYAAALTWYRKAAEWGIPGAEFNLGLLYQSGQGVPRSDREAAGWYAKAAGHGYASAQVRLGQMYAAGRGVPKSDASAMGWFKKAANQGDAEGQARLADMVQDGDGAPRDRFHAMLDRVFGAGRWRETSGYRSVAQENELRKEGAGTVPLGQRSRHSTGNPDAPGAYDIVVDGMSLQLAAAKLKHASLPLARVVAEAAHGAQGPHLHVEPLLTRVSNPPPAEDARNAGARRILIDTPARLSVQAGRSAIPSD